jgi:alkanesulfonate monooxygenase SsuD/methylene tetrahydromethanopterin reductase-like flavin-dependent oxidoreductase (luciferase family)
MRGITLAGLARDTKRIRFGTLVSSATFRHPADLAITVAGVDAMSGGRAELGLSAGWFEEEHTAYSIPFPSFGELFEKLEEQFEIISGLLGTNTDSTYDFSGRHYTLKDSPALPKHTQSPHAPLIVGGHGAKRTPRLAAKFADEFNVPFSSQEISRQQFALVDEACLAIGRDPTSMLRSVAKVICCAENNTDVARRAAYIGREVDDMKQNGLAGTPAEINDKIHEWAHLGLSRLYLEFLDIRDLDQNELLASDVLPALR